MAYIVSRIYPSMATMRTTIDIDDALMNEAMVASGKPTKKAVVEEALREFVQPSRQRRAIQDMSGLGWEGDLHEMRRGSNRAEE